MSDAARKSGGFLMGEDIRLKSKAGEIGADLATPKGTPKGGVVVIQEIFGVNHHVKAVTDKFAADYLALAPRFFDHIKTGIELATRPTPSPRAAST
jgi:carboxymethylenebutenolidase